MVAIQEGHQQNDDQQPGDVPAAVVDFAPAPVCRRHVSDIDPAGALHLGTGHGKLLGLGSGCLHILAHQDSSGGAVARHNEGVSNRRLKTLVLGSTGSIGTQALEVIAANPDRFELVGLAAGGGHPDLLAQQRAQTGVTNLAVADERAAQAIGDVTYHGPDAATRLIENTEADVVLNALVGALGLQPTLTALASGARLALANKESLIAGGPLVLHAAKPGQMVPG